MFFQQDSALAVICDFSSPFEYQMETRIHNVVTVVFFHAIGEIWLLCRRMCGLCTTPLDTSSLGRYRTLPISNSIHFPLDINFASIAQRHYQSSGRAQNEIELTAVPYLQRHGKHQRHQLATRWLSSGTPAQLRKLGPCLRHLGFSLFQLESGR